jgi:hypothetical protein
VGFRVGFSIHPGLFVAILFQVGAVEEAAAEALHEMVERRLHRCDTGCDHDCIAQYQCVSIHLLYRGRAAAAVEQLN